MPFPGLPTPPWRLRQLGGDAAGAPAVEIGAAGVTFGRDVGSPGTELEFAL